MNGLSAFHTKLKQIHEQIDREIDFKTADFEDLVHLPLNELEKNITPAIVLAVGELTTKKSDTQIAAVAGIFQYIFLAHQVHKIIVDEEQPQNERQYPVLVGDYLFGKAFSKICQEDLFPSMKRFTGVIEANSEGVLLRWSFKTALTITDLEKVLAKEKAALTSQAAAVAAELLELPTPFQKKVEEIGFCIGMAWGLWEASANSSLIQTYLKRMKACILELSGYYQVEHLQELYGYMNDAFLTRVKLTSK